MFVMKEIINKRIVNDNINKLLQSGQIDQIVRHFKIIKNKNYNLNEKNIIGHQISENSNIFIGDYDYTSNEYLNDDILFNDYYESSDDVAKIISNAETTAYENFVIDSDRPFSDEELEKIKTVLLNYINGYNELYIRLGIKPEDKNEFVIKLYELYISEYYNELTEEAQNKLKDNELLPILNDIIFYSNTKYNYLNNELVSTIVDIDDDNLDKNIEEL